ncbi:MAG: Crp/Fnr family transcriptional regulator [Eggerthellaceae bacterium]|nr:Crp/Fnr family transcriptional regulator [Eggerthellaceae bacterium]
METKKSCLTCTNPFCAKVFNELYRSKICERAHKIQFKKRNTQVMFFDNGNVFIIEEGYVLIQRSISSDRPRGTQILGPGDIIGIVQLYNHDYQATLDLLPLTPVRGCMVPTGAMEGILQTDLTIANAFIELCTKRIASNSESLAINSFGTSRDRLAFYVDRIRKMGLTSEVTQEDLAILAGLNRVTVTKILNSQSWEERSKLDR